MESRMKRIEQIKADFYLAGLEDKIYLTAKYEKEIQRKERKRLCVLCEKLCTLCGYAKYYFFKISSIVAYITSAPVARSS